jgi:propionyl-CoA carboxylase alpha chain
VKPARALEPSEEALTRLAKLATLWIQGINRQNAQVLRSAPSGWRNGRLFDQKLVLDHAKTSISVRYHSHRDGRFRFADGTSAHIHAWSGDGIDAEVAGRRSQARITRSGDQLIVHGPDGDIVFCERPRFVLPGIEEAAGGFVAQMPGKVIELRVQVGDRVRAGDTLLVLEAMKMEHPMHATAEGIVTEVRVAQDEQVEAGTLLLVVENEGDGEST